MAKAEPITAERMHNRYYGAGGFSAIVAFFANYVNFTGRSTRREYWWMQLFSWLFSIAALIGVIFAVVFFAVTQADTKVLQGAPFWGMVVGLLVYVALMFAVLLPSLSLPIRRYRDAGVPWWLYVIQLVIRLGTLGWLGEDSNVAIGIYLVLSVITIVICALPSQAQPIKNAQVR
ncbi:DUF805 domain-containing protein [Lacticaseibacillus jixiensis]|uniref:DUF805 domain-containing protein n=1 Tax=Lacticaseibacillus jixiensis TaxID=3231926 RepID=UPI0036F21622